LSFASQTPLGQALHASCLQRHHSLALRRRPTMLLLRGLLRSAITKLSLSVLHVPGGTRSPLAYRRATFGVPPASLVADRAAAAPETGTVALPDDVVMHRAARATFRRRFGATRWNDASSTRVGVIRSKMNRWRHGETHVSRDASRGRDT